MAKGAHYTIKKLTSHNQIGWEILHVIARFVDGTPVGANGDWKHLAGLLGLDIHDIIVTNPLDVRKLISDIFLFFFFPEN